MTTAASPRFADKRAEPTSILLLTHSFPPDPAAVGQHMSDLAATLARRGHRVVVITSDRGYVDASVKFADRETTADGVLVRRLGHSSFGKATLIHRAVAIASFMLQAAVVAAGIKGLGGIIFSTSPPFIGTVGTLIGKLRGVPTAFWAMDLNPDQLIALGKLSNNGLLTRILRGLNRFTLRHAAIVVTLDPLMAGRLAAQGAEPDTLAVIPPWSPDEELHAVPRAGNEFREKHGLANFTVVMYSGNHTQSNPLTTLLSAAVALRHNPRLKFVFVGSGTAKREVEEVASRHELRNILSLPYQPRSAIAASLSAADVHVVSLGEQMAGVIHPCKVYGAMAVGRPILYFGPSPSHVSNIIQECSNGWHVSHGDVDATVATLNIIATTPFDELDAMGGRGLAMMQTHFRPDVLVKRVADAIEGAFSTRTRKIA